MSGWQQAIYREYQVPCQRHAAHTSLPEACFPAARAGAVMKMDSRAFRPIITASQLPSELMSSIMRLPTAKSAAPWSAMVTQIWRTRSCSRHYLWTLKAKMNTPLGKATVEHTATHMLCSRDEGRLHSIQEVHNIRLQKFLLGAQA